MSNVVYTADADNPFSFGTFERAKAPYRSGFLTTQLTSITGKPKIVKYDFPKLVKMSAVLTMLCKGTLFNLDAAIYQCMLVYFIAFVLACAALSFFHADPLQFEAASLPPIMGVSTNVQRLTPFLFGLFTSIVLSRWWALRVQGIGAMDDHLINISGLLVSFAARILPRQEDWELFRSIHSKIVKYGLASTSCIAMESRGGVTDESLSLLVDCGWLNEDEKAILLRTPQQSIALWCWITALGAEALEMMKIPAPNHNMLFQEVRMALLGIHCVHEHIGTQLPFPYVHMIVLLVNLNNLVMSAVAGLKCAVSWEKQEYVGCFLEGMEMILVPLLYQALLQVCVFLTDPLGDDIIDFPLLNFQLEVVEACTGQLSVRDLYDQRVKAGQSPLPNAHVEHSLISKKEEATPAPSPPPPVAPKAPERPERKEQVYLERLDSRLEGLAEGLSRLSENVSGLQSQIAFRAVGSSQREQNQQQQQQTPHQTPHQSESTRQLISTGPPGFTVCSSLSRAT